MRVSWLEVRVLCLKGILPPRVYFSSLGVWAHCRYRYDAISAEVWSLFMDKQSFVCIVLEYHIVLQYRYQPFSPFNVTYRYLSSMPALGVVWSAESQGRNN